MKKNILRFLPLIFGTSAFAQEVLKVQQGASITVETGAAITIIGNATLYNGSRLSNSGTITFTGSGPVGTSDFHDSSITPYNYGAGKIVLNRPGGHTMYSNNIFSRIDINTGLVTLGSNISANHWYLQSGKVTTGANMAIVSGTADTDLEAAPGNSDFSNSWINGNLRRFIDPSINDIYQFAIGTNSRHLASLENMLAAPITGVDYIDASFTATPGTDAGIAVYENGRPYISVNAGGVWHFVPNSPPAAGAFNVKLYTNDFTGLVDNQFAILVRPDLSTNPSDWAIPAGSSINPPGGSGRMSSDGYAMRKNVAVFGQFGIGQTSSSALPVTLTQFIAKRLSKLSVQLDWQTQSESNNKGFGVERRTANDTSFIIAGFVNSKALNGNSALTLDYSFIDNNNSYAGVVYYRLKQTDLDDRSYYSLVKAVNGLNGSSVSVMLWPNPSKGQFSIKIEGSSSNKEAMITDLQGKVIKRITITGDQQVNINGLAGGTYVITIINAMGLNANFNEKVVVIK